MATSTYASSPGRITTEPLLNARLVGRGVAGGLMGGAVLAMFMMIVMAANGSGFWSPLNLGISAFAFTVVPPLSMLPSLMTLMGISLPASAMPMIQSAIASGHFTPAVMNKLVAMLTAMHVPASQIHAMAPLMSGTATNADVAALMRMMTVSQRDTMMGMMPVSPGRVIVGMMLHFMMSAVLGVVFLVIFRAARRVGLTLVEGPMGALAAGMLGGALVYAVMRWILLPPTNSMMAFVPQWAFFLAHLMFGAVVGLVVARGSHPRSVRA